jgi:hypothetical protein
MTLILDLSSLISSTTARFVLNDRSLVGTPPLTYAAFVTGCSSLSPVTNQ